MSRCEASATLNSKLLTLTLPTLPGPPKGRISHETQSLRESSAAFAKDIVFAVRALRNQHVESILLNQLLHCETPVGASIHEAQFAQGSRDFISKPGNINPITG